MRGDLQTSVIELLSDPQAVLVVDKLGLLKKGTALRYLSNVGK